MLTHDLIQPAFRAGLPYDAYVAAGTPDQRERWGAFHRRVRLSDPQRSLIAGFSRRINVLVVSGLWCGDCVQQCPMLDHIAKANPATPGSPPGSPGIDLRFVDRDEHRALSDAVRICGGNRVPTALFLNEDLEFVSLMGDKSLARFRALAAKQLGPSCPLPGAPVPDDEVDATLADWVNEFERVALLLRLSAKLRERHGD